MGPRCPFSFAQNTSYRNFGSAGICRFVGFRVGYWEKMCLLNIAFIIPFMPRWKEPREELLQQKKPPAPGRVGARGTGGETVVSANQLH